MKRLLFILAILIIGLIISMLVSICIGSSGLTIAKIYDVIIGQADSASKAIVLKIRLPRILLAAIVGASLSVSGVVLQSLLQNPLAEPYILGISGGAGLGAIIAVALGMVAIPLFAFVGALATIFLLYWVTRVEGKMFIQSLLLVGVILNAIYSAIIIFIASLMDPFKVHNLSMWLMGNISVVDYKVIFVIAIFTLLGIIILFSIAKNLNPMSLGEESAVALGVDVEKTKILAFILASLIVGVAVSQTGIIAFVGFIVPHLLRLIVGPDNRILLPTSAIAGAIFLVLSDTIARAILTTAEMPVGVITIVLGGPIFIWMLLANQKRVTQ